MEIESDSDSGVQEVTAENIPIDSLSEKSRISYETAYNGFTEWQEKNKRTSISEDVLIAYFEEIMDTFNPTTLWALYSKLRTTISFRNNVDLEDYTKLKDLLKEKSKGDQPKKLKTLETSKIKRFIQEAPDSKYLVEKVALIMGLAGACRMHELYQMTTSNIKDSGSTVVITIPSLQPGESRKFGLSGRFYCIFKKYADLRPPNCAEPYFFLNYKNGNCAAHRMDFNKFGSMVKQIAKYSKLPDAETYTGHSFHEPSATIIDADENDEKETLADSKSATLEDKIGKNQMLNANVASTSGMKSQNESGVDGKIDPKESSGTVDDIPNGNVGSTSNTKSQDEGGEFCEIAPKETVIAAEEEDSSGFKGPSTSIISSSENETNDRPYSVSEDPLAEDMYQDEDDEDSEAEDKNFEMLDVTDSQVLQGEVEPLRVEVNNDNISSKECDLFGEYIAKHLQRLPVEMALKLQSGIQALVMQTRLEYIREHPSEAPAMVKEERSAEDSTRTSDAADNATQNGTEKRSQNTDQQQQPAAKRFKPNSSGQETTKSKSSTTHAPQNQNRRTEYTVFAEHIALQLEQLPEDVSIQLQTEIYDLITQTYSKHTDEDVPNRVKIKDEIHYVDPSELIDL